MLELISNYFNRVLKEVSPHILIICGAILATVLIIAGYYTCNAKHMNDDHFKCKQVVISIKDWIHKIKNERNCNNSLNKSPSYGFIRSCKMPDRSTQPTHHHYPEEIV